MRFCVTIVLTILLQFRLVWATEFSSGCNIFLTVATFNSTHDLTEYHVVIKENDIYLQSSHKTIALNPRSMKPSTALSNEDLKSSLELRKDKCINTKRLQQCAKPCNHTIVNAYNNTIQFCGLKMLVCSDENDLDNNECNKDDSAFLTYNIINHSRFNQDFPTKITNSNLLIRLICHSNYSHLVHPFKQIVFMNFVTSSSYQKQPKNFLYLTFADDFEKELKRKMTYGICVVDADNALALLNTKRDASEKDGFYKSINASGLINGVLSTSTPVALLDFKFTDEEIIDHKVMPNFPDTKGQLYDVHFIATSSRIFKCITSSTINACFVLICEFKNIEQIEIWNRELLLIKTNSNVFSVPLYKCGLYNCFECFQVDDPFCGWDVTTATCIDISFANESTRASTKQGMYEKNPSKFCSSVMEFTQEEILHKIDQLKEGVANIRIEIDELRAYMESIYGQPPVDYLNKILEIDQLKEGVANIRTILEDLKKFLAKNNISENHTKIEDKELSILIEYLRNISVGIQNQNELSHNINELLAQLAAQNNNNNFYFYIILAIIFAVTRIFVNLISMVLKWVYKNCKYKYCKPTTTPNNETLEDVIVKKHNKHSKSHGNDHKDKNVDKNEPDDDNDDTKSKELEKLIEKNEGNKKSSANGRYVDDPTEGNDKVKKRKK